VDKCERGFSGLHPHVRQPASPLCSPFQATVLAITSASLTHKPTPPTSCCHPTCWYLATLHPPSQQPTELRPFKLSCDERSKYDFTRVNEEARLTSEERKARQVGHSAA